MVIISSEYFQIITAGIYAIALFYTIVTFRRTKRLDQITLSNNIFNDLRDLDRELAKIPSGSQYDNARSPWYCRTFNTLDWLSFLINEKVINERKMIEYMKPIIVRYYEDTFLKNASVDEKDSKSYQQFKILYQTIKN
ncbi:MAG TPA: hypothetical protein VKA91_01590 [Nitrososphaeraceae archaeon]|nr:hypothetical protein [Nitrososphaeraceae archaeon]